MCAPSLNECLYSVPPLQNKLSDILVRQRFHPLAIFGDIQKAFLQIQIKENERDALRFHWQVNKHSNLDTYRFTRDLFGLTCSPFLLGGLIKQHLQSRESKLPEVVAALHKSLYVDNLLKKPGNVRALPLRYLKMQSLYYTTGTPTWPN